MLIDWFTIGAQIVNFVVLVWLLKRFLYKPILNAIDEREKRIAAELANAALEMSQARTESEELARKNEEFDRQRASLLSRATDEAKVERQRLLEEAAAAADAVKARRQKSLRDEERALQEAITRRTQEEVFAIARKTLADLASASLAERLGEVFTRRLLEMDGPARTHLAEAIRGSHEPALIRTAFDLPEKQRAALQDALNETLSAEVHVRFETAPQLISGIELIANGQKVSWSIAEYLASLAEGVDELLTETEGAEAGAESGSVETGRNSRSR